MGDNPKTALERMNEAWENKSKPLADMTIEEAQEFFDSLAPISDDITAEAARNGDTAAGYLLELEKLDELMTRSHNVLSPRGIDTAMDEYRKELYGDAKAAELQQAEAERKEAEKAANEQVQAVHDAHSTVQAAATLCATACRYAMHGLIVLPRLQADPKIPSLRASQLPFGGLKGDAEVYKHWQSDGHKWDGISCLQGIEVINHEYVTVTIDLDRHGDDGRKSLHEWMEQHHEVSVPPALCVGTDGDRGGLHIHLAIRAGVLKPDCDGIGVLPGVDVLYKGRTAIMPPTYRPDKLTSYAWLGLYDFRNDTITPLPPAQLPASNNAIEPWSRDDDNMAYAVLLDLLFKEGAKRKAAERAAAEAAKAEAAKNAKRQQCLQAVSARAARCRVSVAEIIRAAGADNIDDLMTKIEQQRRK